MLPLQVDLGVMAINEYFLTHDRKDEGVHTYSKDMNPKANEIACLKFELAYYDITVLYISHYNSKTPSDTVLWTRIYCQIGWG